MPRIKVIDLTAEQRTNLDKGAEYGPTTVAYKRLFASTLAV